MGEMTEESDWTSGIPRGTGREWRPEGASLEEKPDNGRCNLEKEAGESVGEALCEGSGTPFPAGMAVLSLGEDYG